MLDNKGDSIYVWGKAQAVAKIGTLFAFCGKNVHVFKTKLFSESHSTYTIIRLTLFVILHI